MSRGKKQQKKRKYRSPSPPVIKSQIARRLEKIRSGRTNLWDDDDDDDDDDENIIHEQPKIKHNRKSHVMLSDSDEERPSTTSQRQLESSKAIKKTSRHHHHHHHRRRESATCLICSVLSQLSSYNCCSAHLSVLKNLSQHQTKRSRRLPEQVIIVPMADNMVQRYLDQQPRRRTSTSPITQKHPDGELSTRKSSRKLTMTPNHPNVQRSIKKTPKTVANSRSTQADTPPLASTIVIEPAHSNPTDIANTTVTSSTSPTTAKNVHDTRRTTDAIEQDNSFVHSTHNRKPIDPWKDITEETDAALEQVLSQIESFSDSPLEYTPTTARRTNTEIMAARLPKIPLKQGRFRNGRPINNRTISTNGPNEYRPSAAVQTSPPSSSVVTVPASSPPPPTSQVLIRSENHTDHHDIFTQDEITQNHNISITTHTNEFLPSISNENSAIEAGIDRSNGNISTVLNTTKGKGTPSRLSIRLNPDGSQVKISKPPLPTNYQSPSINSLRRTSTDVTFIQPNTKQL